MFEQDGVMIPFEADTDIKHGLKQVGKKFMFSINGVNPEDAGLYQVEVDGVKIFSTELKSKIIHGTAYLVPNMIQLTSCKSSPV